jgi:DNA-binding NarL/FixJ family response regulator
MADAFTVLLVDDHPTFRLGLKQIITSSLEFRIIGEAGDGQSAVEMAVELKPNIVTLDWDLPKLNGLEVARELRRRKLGVRILILTMHQEEALFNEAMEAGVDGFLIKDNAVTEIQAGLKAVAAGDAYLSPVVSNFLLRRTRRAQALRQERPGLDQLTPMERRVLKLVAENRSTKEIASAIGVSPRTVETHRRNISQKLDLHGSHRLLQFALVHRHELDP